MQDVAFSEYYEEAVKPCGDGRNFSKSPAAKGLTWLTERYLAICEELEKRAAAENKCTNCIHNIGGAVMDCECACTGVTEVKDKAHIVASCNDYQQRVEQPG